MKNDHTIEGELVCPPYTKQAGKSQKHLFRISTMEPNYRGDLIAEEHTIETFDESLMSALKGVGVGSIVSVRFRLRSNSWRNKQGELIYFTRADLFDAPEVKEKIEPSVPYTKEKAKPEELFFKDDPNDEIPF